MTHRPLRAMSLIASLLLLLALSTPAGAVVPLAPPVAPDLPLPEVVDEALEMAGECGVDLPMPLAVDDPPPPFAALTACPGIRPGAFHSVEGSGCTFNFVFRGTSYDKFGRPVDEGLFIGTAGHCVFDAASPDKAYAPGEGRVVTDGQGRRVGEVAYGVDEGALDFALIRIDDDREDQVNPSLCHFGGPVAIGGGLSRGDVVHHFGDGVVFGDTVQGRSGLADNYASSGSVLNFNTAAGPGDSGSPVIDETGRAVGVLVRLSPIDTGVVEATDLSFHLARATTFTGVDFSLVKAPLGEDPDDEDPPVR